MGVIKDRLARFFEERSPKSDTFALSIKNIYVFFSRQGVLFLGLLVITFIAGVNYANNLILGLFFYLLSIWLVSAVLTFLQLSSLQIAFQTAHLTEAEQLLWVTLRLAHTQGKPARQIALGFYELDDGVFEKRHLKNHSAVSKALERLSASERQAFLQNYKTIVPALDKEVVVKLPVLTDKRGAVVLPRLNIKSTYPLGVVQAWGYGRFASTGFAYPVPMAFEEHQDKQRADTPDEYASNFYRVGQDEFDRLDTYKEGENLARVSWSHVARGMGMLTKHFTDPVGQTYCIDYDAMPASHHEDKLAQMAKVVLAMKGQAGAFAIRLPSGEMAGQGDEFVQKCLLALAKEP